jgi:hypothetical protein
MGRIQISIPTPAIRTAAAPLSVAISAVMIVTAAALVPAPAFAQDHCSADVDVSDAALAARYAPVIRFAPSEPDFPTLPFFYAMDGFDNDGDGQVDFDDPDEITAYLPGDTLPSWEILSTWYDEALRELSPDVRHNTPVAPLPAVHYRVKTLSDKEQSHMRRFLKQDIMMWSRAERSDLHQLNLLQKPFKVIEYYFYYVRDQGLVGHPQDIEFTFVFVPADPSDACEARLIVGAGHTERVPNNVLLLTNLMLGIEDAAREDTLTGVLSELGGHSSSPDVNPYGKFRLGLDVNWQANKTWGTRDVQSLARMGYGGPYRPDMTLERGPEVYSVTLWPRGATYDYGQDYALIPAPLLEELYAVLGDVSAGIAPGGWPATIDSVTVLLDVIADLMGVDRFIGVESLDAAAVERMAGWTKPMIAPPGPEGGVIPTSRGQVWEHYVYEGEASVLFKSHLFPPTMRSIEEPQDVLRLITWGFSTWPGNSHQFQVGLIIPWFELPFEVRGFMDLQAGIMSSSDFEGTDFSLNFSYYNSYFQRVTWYTTVAWLPNDEITGSHFTVSAGPSFLLWMRSHKSLLGPLNALRFSTGPRFRLSSGSTNTHSVDWEFKFSFRQ